jgi:hypothetical protein
VYTATQIPAETYEQFFRDSGDEKHCIIHEILRWADECLSRQETARGKQRYNAVLCDAKQFAIEFDDGLPESQMQRVCDQLQVSIKIVQPFNPEPFIVFKPATKALFNFKYKNTRIKHVQAISGGIVSQGKPIVVSKDELRAILDQKTADHEYCEYKKCKTGLSKLYAIENTYMLASPYSDVANEFEKTSGLANTKLCHIHDKNVSQFVLSSARYNCTVDFQDTRNFRDNLDLVNHIDARKAYTNYAMCPYYDTYGFLGKITDYRKCSKQHGTGLYQLENLTFWRCNSKFKIINDFLCVYEACGGVVASPEIAFMDDMKIGYTIVAGAWGVKPLKITMPDDMLQKDEDGVAYYAHHTGASNRVVMRH